MLCGFFLQAEDGIRDLVRSRGLGDVYKRQANSEPMSLIDRFLFASSITCAFSTQVCAHEGMWLPTLLQAIEGNMRTEGLLISAEDIYSSVSYTHLTLPTSDLV